jgi:hypothetical protein
VVKNTKPLRPSADLCASLRNSYSKKYNLTTDFRQKILPVLYNTLKEQGYDFITFSEFLAGKDRGKFVILRHDVEKHYDRALKFAEIQHRLGIKGTYFFRMSSHFDEKVIRRIAALGHEAGYHYDDLSRCHGDYAKAIERFKNNLEKLRRITDIRIIAMDGSPLSKYDNRLLWDKYDYSDYGIAGEPYFDVDYHKVHYLTDTGRRWDGRHVSVRDKVNGNQELPARHTKDLINLAAKRQLPDRLLITFHPQRWTDSTPAWLTELIWQNLKNQVKRLLVKTGR